MCIRDSVPLDPRAVADHQPPTLLIDLVGERLNVRGDLGLQRRSEHLPVSYTHLDVYKRQLHSPVAHRPAHTLDLGGRCHGVATLRPVSYTHLRRAPVAWAWKVSMSKPWWASTRRWSGSRVGDAGAFGTGLNTVVRA